MAWFSKLLTKKSLGIDIGTSSIKIVEISSRGGRKRLENYGEISSKALYERPFRTFEKSTLLLSSRDISRAILAIIKEAKIETKKAVFSIPDFTSFFTNFELPPMTKEELPQAVTFEARRHIPLPLGEVTIDWEVVEGQISPKKKTPLKVLLVAVPKEVINQYQEIASLSGLELLALEAEVFGLCHSLIPEEEKRVISLIDIGAQSTTCSIIDRGVLKRSCSFDIAGNQLTDQVARSLSLDYKRAEEIRKEYGIFDQLLPESFRVRNLREVLLPLFDLILREVERVRKDFYQKEGKEVEKFILAGGVSLTPGLREYFKEQLKKEVEIANPFSQIFYPPILEEELKKMGPTYAIAVGMALRGIEQQ